MSKELEAAKGVSHLNQDILRNRIKTGTTLEIYSEISQAANLIREAHPQWSAFKFYQELADILPPRESPGVRAKIFQAMACTDPDISNAGKRLMIFFNLKTILTVAERFRTGEDDFDSDLVHEGITETYKKYNRLNKAPDATQINGIAVNAMARYVASELGIPTTWVTDGTYKTIIWAVDQALKNHYSGNYYDFASRLANTTGEDSDAIFKYIMDIVAVENIDYPQDPEEALYDSQLKAAVDDIMGVLNGREKDVIELRFGLKDGIRHTLEEVGKLLGLTNEGVRHIEQNAFNKIRSPQRAVDLKPFRAKRSLFRHPDLSPDPVQTHPLIKGS